MQKITCHARVHRGKERLFLEYPYSISINNLLKKIPGCTWSQTQKQWHLPLDEDSYQQLCTSLEGVAVIDDHPLKEYRQKPRPANTITPAPAPMAATEKPAPAKQSARVSVASPGKIAAVNKHVLPAFKQQLVLKAYSPSTLTTYLSEMTQFLMTIKNHPADEFTPQRIRDYLQYCFEVLHLRENTLHSRINSLKFYFEQVLKKEKFYVEFPKCHMKTLAV